MPDRRIRAPLPERSLALARGIPRALSRPTGMVEGTRWLFMLLAMISLALSAPSTLLAGRDLRLLEVASLAMLGASLMTGYLTRRAHWALDLLDGVALVGLACSGPSPSGVFALVFAMIWFRSLYGSTGGAALRSLLYGASMVSVLGVWPSLPGAGQEPDPAMILSVLPTMVVTVVAARHLAGIIRDRQQAAHRDAVHAAAGARLLGVTDQSEIRRIVWRAIADICAATPGLRVLSTREQGGELQVAGLAGAFLQAPSTLTSSLRSALERHDLAGPPGTGLSEIDDAVGASCEWRCLLLVEKPASEWLVLASPGRIKAQSVDALTSLVTQGILAMRNSHAHHELTVQATSDGLTGLANRTLFNKALSAALHDAAGTETAVMFVDLDDFKDVNDVFGHAAGDELLREVAKRIAGVTRSRDLCARLGGDEFAVLLPRTGAEEATEIGRRIVEAVAQPLPLPDGAVRVGASVGLAVDLGDSTPEQLVQRADIAMYAAKAGGKGQTQVFSPGLLQADAAQVSFDRQLLAATANEELVVVYQPIVSMTDGRCTALEALVRWNHPERGLLGPDTFIAAAERTGAIHDIGDLVLRRACADLSELRRSPASSHLVVHVNVSALQLDSEGFVARVVAALEEFSMAPEELVLEITETVVISSPSAIDQLNRLAEHGVLIAIDDFGTGYSALTTLRALPVSIVKIDRSFVAGSTVNAEDRAVTEAVVQMAARMGLRTIAEGVERPDQLAFLESLGTDSAQGFLYLRPADTAAMAVWLEDNLAAHSDHTAPRAGTDPGRHAGDVVLSFAPPSGSRRR